MNELTAALKEELNVDTAFTLPIFGGIDIPESIAVSWGIMAFLVIVSILLTRNLKVNHISKRQAILETAVVTMDNFFKDLLGEAGKQYVPYLITVALYIACSNLIGIIGLKPPTKDLNVTAALAIMSIVLIEYSGIHAKGGKRFVHSLAEPIALMTPMNILEIAIRPTSLCMLSASGWRLMASAALPVAMPMPMPAPMPVSAAMPAPKATKLAIINYSFL